MAALAVLRPGDWVRFDGGEHEVLAVAGTSVRLRSAAGLARLIRRSGAPVDGVPIRRRSRPASA